MKKAYTKADIDSAIEKAVIKALANQKPKSTTVAQTEKRTNVQGQPIEVYPNKNLGLTQIECDTPAQKKIAGFIQNSVKVATYDNGDCQIFASSFVNAGKFRGKLVAYLSKEQKIAMCKAIMENPHKARTDV